MINRQEFSEDDPKMGHVESKKPSLRYVKMGHWTSQFDQRLRSKRPGIWPANRQDVDYTFGQVSFVEAKAGGMDGRSWRGEVPWLSAPKYIHKNKFNDNDATSNDSGNHDNDEEDDDDDDDDGDEDDGDDDDDDDNDDNEWYR